MIGGHYIAYTLVDPERMFEDGKKVVEAMRDLDMNGGGHDGQNGEMPSVGNDSERKRVWCYCSE
jgi:ubiquitin carboxyl-terminal hydrolase 16/45